MKKSRIVFLIGMPGVGKSYWGRAWAEQHAWSFIDLDEQVEEMTGVSISKIFASAGEDGFRAIETHMLETVVAGCGSVPTIIATGGGTPVFGDNMEFMLGNGCVVWLQAKSGTLLRQLRESTTERPLIANQSESFLDQLLHTRQPYYSRAHVHLSVERIGQSTFGQIETACTNRRS